MKPKPRKAREVPVDLSRPEDEWTLTVNRPAEGMRLDKFVSENLPWRSRTRIKKDLQDGRILVEGKKVKASYSLKLGEEIVVTADNSHVADQDPSKIELDVLYEDDVLLALNKQPGVVVHPAGRYRYNTVINALHLRYRNTKNPEKDVVPRLCHRIDKYTSGLLLVAKDERTRRLFQYQFERMNSPELPPEAEEIDKKYLFITVGVPEKKKGIINEPIGPDGGPIRIKMAVREDGLDAKTEYEVLGDFGQYAFVRASIHTGRTHQIRVHFSHIGTPVASDHLYSNGEPIQDAEGIEIISRCALHSESIRFFHPGKGEMMELSAPLAEDMKRAVDILSKGC